MQISKKHTLTTTTNIKQLLENEEEKLNKTANYDFKEIQLYICVQIYVYAK